MLSPLTRFNHSVITAFRLTRNNPALYSRFIPISSRSFVTESDGKTEKVRTPNLDEINREDGPVVGGMDGGKSRSDHQARSENSRPEAEASPVEAELRQEMETLKGRLEEVDEKYKRALAEAENTRIRMRRQIEDAKIYSIQGFCKDLLEVADILQAALKSVKQEEIKDENFKSLFKGVEMTEKQLQSIFRRHGLNQLNPIGLKFNPNEHHAIYEAEDASKEPGTVAAVNQIGYKLFDRTVRPAMVGVVKGQMPPGE